MTISKAAVLIFTIVYLSIIGCGKQPEESSSWNDSYVEKAFEEKLKENDIEHYKEGRQFFYPVKKRDAVSKVRSEILEEFYPSNNFLFENKEDLSKALLFLKEAGIAHRVIQLDDGKWVSWEEQKRDEGLEIISNITGIPMSHLRK